MVSKTNEQALEASIEKYLTGTCLEEQAEVRDSAVSVPAGLNHGYQLGRAQDFNARYAVDSRCLRQFLEASQGDELERLKQRYDDCLLYTSEAETVQVGVREISISD